MNWVFVFWSKMLAKPEYRYYIILSDKIRQNEDDININQLIKPDAQWAKVMVESALRATFQLQTALMLSLSDSEQCQFSTSTTETHIKVSRKVSWETLKNGGKNWGRSQGVDFGLQTWPTECRWKIMKRDTLFNFVLRSPGRLSDVRRYTHTFNDHYTSR